MQKRFLQYLLSSKWLVWAATLLSTLFTTNSSAKAQVTPSSDGTGTRVTQSGNTFDIEGGTQSGGNLFHKFEDFSIQPAETANFTSDSSVFNIVGQVAGGNPSYIEGQVQVSGSDANLYLVNPAGVLFGPDAQLSLSGSFAATTADQVGFAEAWLDVAEDGAEYSRLSANPSAYRFTPSEASPIVNRADLSVAAGESLTLMGGSVVSEGSAVAPGGEVGLVAVGGDSTVRLTTPDSLLSLEVSEGGVGNGISTFAPITLPTLLTGRSSTDASDVASRLSIDDSGVARLSGSATESGEVAIAGNISASSSTNRGGSVALLGNSIEVLSGTVEASGLEGGTVRIGGGVGGEGNLPTAQTLLIEAGVNVLADGRADDGGSIVAFAENTATLQGAFSAQGNAPNAQGGFVETSADFLDLSGASVDASGQAGGGQWLIDPVDIEIVSGPIGVNQIDTASIVASLDSGVDVAIATSSGSGGSGDISLLNSIQQTGASTASLTLSGRRFITNGSVIDLESTGQLTFEINKVNPLTMTDSSSIDSAISAIGTVNGDRVIDLAAGTYDFSDAVVVDTDVSIVGDTAANTLLRAVDTNRVFEISPNVTAAVNNLTFTTAGLAASQSGGGIDNSGDLTVENSLFANNRSNAFGGAINSQSGTLAIAGSRFENNSARQGGGVSVQGGEATITDSTFFGNQAVLRGGALYLSTREAVDIARTTVDGNTSDMDGGGITLDAGGIVEIVDSNFINNVADDDGGGLHHISGTAVLLDVSVINNTARDMGGGLYQFASANMTVIDSLISNNQAGNEGGGLINNSARGAITTLLRADFANNTAVNSGGGLFSRTTGLVDITDSDFTDNEAQTMSGGAVHVENSARLTISGGRFNANSAGTDGGAIAVLNNDAVEITNATVTNNTAADDGAGFFARQSPRVTVTNSTFDNNRANDDGGGLYAIESSQIAIRNAVVTNNAAGDTGGGIYSRTDTTVAVENGSVISGNSAAIGGGIGTDQNGTDGLPPNTLGATLNVSDSTISNNSATRQGGGIANLRFTQEVAISNTLLEANTAPEGGGIFSSAESTLSLNGATFRANDATASDGGALFLGGSVAVDIADSIFVENTSADQGGAVFYASTEDLTIANTRFSRNESVSDGGAVAHNASAAFSATGTLFEENQSDEDGGAIFAGRGTTTQVDNTTFRSNQAAGSGGGLSVLGGQLNIVGATTFDQNSAQSGGGLSAFASNVDINGTAFNGNTALEDGGGVVIQNDSTAAITNSSFSRNTADDDGGGLYATRNSAVSLVGAQIEENSAVDTGGGLYASIGSSLDLSAVRIERNQAFDGGGVGAIDSDVVVSNGTITLNQATNDGGGLFHESGRLDVVNIDFIDNVAAGGGGIALTGDVVASLSDRTTLSGNIADVSGGGLATNSTGTLTVENSSVLNNQATVDGGGIFVGRSAVSGAAIGDVDIKLSAITGNTAGEDGGGIFSEANSTLNLSGLEINRNTAGVNGGAIALQGTTSLSAEATEFSENSATGSGGGIHFDASASATILSSDFVANETERAGGAIANTSESALLTVSDSLFADNTARSNGGAITSAANSQTVISDSTFERNQAEFGGAIAGGQAADITLRSSRLQNNVATVAGGGIRLGDASATIEQSQIVNNRARFGGALELSASSRATVVDSDLSNNGATVLGGAILVDDDSSLSLTQATLSANQASAGGGLSIVGTADLVNTTLSGNVATQDGGGITLLGPDATLIAKNTTLTNNSASESGGISIRDNLAIADLLNTIVAGNTASGSALTTDVKGRFTDSGNNLIGVADATAGFSSDSLVGTADNPLNPRLAPLADNGGLTQTHLLQSDSAAINAGISALLPTTDQRGLARTAGAAVDIGAVEMDASELPADVFNAIAPNAPTDPNPDPIPETPAPTDPETTISSFPSALDFSSLIGSPSPTDSDDSMVAVLPPSSADDSRDADNKAIRKLEQTFGQSFEDYWDLSLGPDLSFDEVQVILRRAKEEYQVNSAVIYASFVPASKEESETTEERKTEERTTEEGSTRNTLLTLAPEPSDDDLLNLSLIMPEGSLVDYQLPFTRKEINQQVDLFRATASDPIDELGYKPFSHRAYEWLLASLENDLAAQGIQNLMYSLDAELRTAPITAMQDQNGFALERYGISVVPNMGLMQTDFGVPVRRATIAMGVAEFAAQEPLPAVPVELGMVSEFVTASQTVLNEGTTLEALKAIQRLEQPGILHLATHADFDAHSPESSYIQLWEEPLSMAAFRQLDWKGSDLEMLILSACSTAMSSPRAGLGFAGLAAAAGVDSTVGSLWQVSDVGTLALMSEFYAQLESTDLRVEALRRAQLALLRGETRIENGDLITSRGAVDLPDEWNIPQSVTLDHPFFWSAFTMVGNPW